MHAKSVERQCRSRRRQRQRLHCSTSACARQLLHSCCCTQLKAAATGAVEQAKAAAGITAATVKEGVDTVMAVWGKFDQDGVSGRVLCSASAVAYCLRCCESLPEPQPPLAHLSKNRPSETVNAPPSAHASLDHPLQRPLAHRTAS